MGKRYLVMVEGDDGWCEWIHPLPGYKMACCDCGLVHEMQFKYLKNYRRIIFRARRHRRATAAIRAWRKRREDQNGRPETADGS